MIDPDVERRIAVTGASGRLGGALVAAMSGSGIGWSRPDYDLDRVETVAQLLERDRPSIVIHSAAMTAVDAAAEEPELAMLRNGTATGALARACHAAGIKLVVVSTNEVFDGLRTDGHGYSENDRTAPGNAYGRSKLAGETAAEAAYGGDPGLWIVRTAWLYGPPGGDFPDKITAAADRLAAGEPLPVVADEFGSPTFTVDLAGAILALLDTSIGGLFHLVNEGQASRLDWARRVLAARRPDRGLRSISSREFVRASRPPPWGVLDSSRAESVGVVMRSWQEALDEYLATG